ncbi:hypothetical protein PTE30175_00452 [Pandoraea terrae]|uniref:Porin n=1 Tax=Pandoraea terrae TaxID=1537710 RepID=A0A5E4S1X1_9BURK|nr:DcaP family trimeric outer membrane transporter [Pandoraea terrae]VVD68624.1 hypothetical protein PTE30175_00452 [Pandoraea terrae]
MKVHLKVLTAALGLTAVLAPPARADQLSDLQTQVALLMKKIDALQAQQKTIAEKQAAAETTAKASTQASAAATPVTAAAAAAPAAPVNPGWFQVPGTDTQIKFGGYAQLAMMVDTKGNLGNSQTVILPFTNAFGGIPYDNTPQSKRSGQMQFEARESRLNIQTSTPTQYGPLTTLIEGDFYGAGGSKFTTNSVSLRLRHAMGAIGPWMFGQYWSNFGDLAQGPEVFDFGGPVGLPAVNRQPQIRYTHLFSDKLQGSASLEQPVQDFTGADAVAFTAGANTISTNSIDQTPEVTARLTYFDTWGRQSAAAVVRKLKASDGVALSAQAYGYAVNYQGTFNLPGRDKVYYDVVYQNGGGRYLTQTPTSAFLINNQLYKVAGLGLNLSYQHWWAENWRSTLSIGRDKIYNPALAPTTSLAETQSVHANVIWSPFKKTLFGLEYIYARIKNEAGLKGSGSRIMFVSQIGF